MRALGAAQTAWLVFRDRHCRLGRDAVARTHRARDRCQTCSRFTQDRDILFVYDKSAHEITMVGRAGSDAYRGDAWECKSRWYVVLRYVVEIAPITFSEFCDYAGEKFKLIRGQSGKFVRPDVAEKLLKRARAVYPDANRAFWPPHLAPREGLPDPGRGPLAIRDLPDIDKALLRVEEEVEYYVLEPFLQAVTRGVGGCKLEKRKETGTGVADYAILLEGEPVCVVEAKKRIPTPRAGWESSKEVQQALGYCHELGAASVILADRSQFLCFIPGRTEPVLRVQRSELTPSHISRFREVMIGDRSRRRRSS